MAAEIHVNDTGTYFRLTLKDEDGNTVDLTTPDVTSIDIVFKKPDATTITRVSEFVNDGTDGLVQYQTVSDDLDQPGKWSIQAFVNVDDGVWHSDIIKFKVEANLK